MTSALYRYAKWQNCGLNLLSMGILLQFIIQDNCINLVSDCMDVQADREQHCLNTTYYTALQEKDGPRQKA